MRRFRLYDSLAREVRLFVPRTPPFVGLFACGLTPYDDAHIGHAKLAVSMDVVARALRRWGYRVLYIQNVTNLDDRLIARGAQEGIDPLTLAERHFLHWSVAMERLGVRSVNYYPFATDYIPEILAQVSRLVEKGFAYVADGSVYFEVAKFPGYGKLSGQRVEALQAGARVEVDRSKRAPEDFVIWKAATPGETSWESPWGPGRPGWHIEDTAITGRLLGPTYDLHGGGLDLKFPHHEAEVALAESASGVQPFVNYWMHVGLLNFRGEKMSKSLGNVVALDRALDEFGGEVLRFFYLNAHYRSPLEFVDGKSLPEAREAYARLRGPSDRLHEELERGGEERAGRDLPVEAAAEASGLVDRLDELMAEDFNTREAIALLFGWSKAVTTHWLPHVAELSGAAIAQLQAPYRWAEEVLGLLPRPSTAPDGGRLDRVVGVALGARTRARARGDFAEADRIRSELDAAGVRLEDSGRETRWKAAPPGGA